MKDKKNKNELVTSDDIPSNPLSVPISKRDKERMKDDPLYKKRVKQNPKLQKQYKKLGENTMKTVVTFSSQSTEAISRQWHLMFTVDDKGWNSWDISKVSHSGNTSSFTVTSHSKDQRMNQKWLSSYLVAGVKMDIAKSQALATESEVVSSVLDMDLDPEKMADILLNKAESLTEAEVPDDEDAESDTIDDVQTMLTKMLPKTKGLKMAPEKEKELKATLKKAMSMMSESKSRNVYAASGDPYDGGTVVKVIVKGKEVFTTVLYPDDDIKYKNKKYNNIIDLVKYIAKEYKVPFDSFKRDNSILTEKKTESSKDKMILKQLDKVGDSLDKAYNDLKKVNLFDLSPSIFGDERLPSETSSIKPFHNGLLKSIEKTQETISDIANAIDDTL